MNTKTVGLVVAALALCGALAACAGFNLGDLIKVKTPADIQKTEGTPATLTLNEAETEYKLWVEKTKAVGVEWKGRISSANEVRSMLGQLTMTGLDSVGPTLGGIPVLGPVLPALTAAAGLFVGRSGLRKEKEASFNKGHETGVKAAKTKE